MTHDINSDSDICSDCSLCIYTVPSPGGSGKTYTIARAARFLAGQGKKVLIVQPTKDLIEKTIEKEIKSRLPEVDCEAIHSDSHFGRVKLEIIKRLEINDDGPGQDLGTITLITHAAFINLPVFPGRGDVFVFVDEVPNAAKCKTHNLSQTHAHLTDSIEVFEHDAIYGRVEVTDADALEKIAKNETDDDLWKQLSETAWLLLSDAWDQQF
jgi:reverse gyrase